MNRDLPIENFALALLTTERGLGVPLPTHRSGVFDFKETYNALSKAGIVRYAMNVESALHCSISCSSASKFRIYLLVVDECADDEQLIERMGKHRGLSNAFAAAFLREMFLLSISPHAIFTKTGRNALRLPEIDEWLIWFWQENRKSWYIQLTDGKSTWKPDDRIFMSAPPERSEMQH